MLQLLLALLLLALPLNSSCPEIGMVAVINRVVEVHKRKLLSYSGSTIRVRLADINAPELGTP